LAAGIYLSATGLWNFCTIAMHAKKTGEKISGKKSDKDLCGKKTGENSFPCFQGFPIHQ